MQQEFATAPPRTAARPQPRQQPEPRQRVRTPTGVRARPDTAQTVGTPEAVPAPGARPEPDHRNEILVAGRITAEPFVRELPSGDRLATWRICVARPSDSRYGGRRADSVTCTSFDRDLQERIRLWRLGDVVRMTGELRRRTWRGHEGVRSVCEVEARTATLVRAAENHTAVQR